MSNIPNETVSIGEGFAFFRWHLVAFAGCDSTCSYPDRDNVCAREWDDMKPEAHVPALRVPENPDGR